MKKFKIIQALILGIFLISLTNALDLTSGEQTIINLSEQYAYYSIVGNSTEVNLNISQEGNQVTIIPDKYMKSDNFTLIFFNTEKEVITVYSGGGSGGGTITKYVNKTRNILIPKYIDREVIKEVPIEIIKEPIIEYKIPVWYQIIFFTVLFILGLAFWIKYLYRTERRLK